MKNVGSQCGCRARNAPHTIEVAQELARERGGVCLSDTYKNSRAKLEWRCAAGHEWKASLDSVKHGRTWCPTCSRCSRSAQLSIEVASMLAEAKGGVCLSTEYKNIALKLHWRCASGHEFYASLNTVKNIGTWCPHCAGNAKLSIQIAQQLAKEKGGHCLSDVYRNSGALLQWACAQGHSWKASLNSIRHHRSWCPTCAENIYRVSRRRRLGLDVAQAYASTHSGQCLSSEYINVKQKMRWRCAAGHEWDASLASMKYRGSWCPKCSQAHNCSTPEMRVRKAMEASFPGQRLGGLFVL